MKYTRTPEDKFNDFKERGKTEQQMRAVAAARSDTDFLNFLKGKSAQASAGVFA